MTDWDREAFTRALIADMRANGGHATSGPLAGQPLAILTTTGARTGEARQAIVTYHRDGNRWVVAGTKSGAPTHPAWYHNLVANPDAEIEVENTIVPVRAMVVDGPERDRLWDDHVAVLPHFAEYPSMTDRVIPVIALERRPAA